MDAMRRPYFGPSPASIHVAAGPRSGTDKHRRARTNGNSLMTVEASAKRQGSKGKECAFQRNREKKAILDGATKSKRGMQESRRGTPQSRACAEQLRSENENYLWPTRTRLSEPGDSLTARAACLPP